MNNIIIGSTTHFQNNQLEISYSISNLNINGKYTISDDDYTKAFNSSGFDGVKKAILDGIITQLTALKS